MSAEVFAADLAQGALLRSYNFKKYVTRKGEGTAEEETRCLAFGLDLRFAMGNPTGY